MSLKKLRLFNFRNYRDFESDFFETNIILGPNASGKTNIAEAIYLLSTTKSFRTSQNQNLISFGESLCKVGGQIEDKDKKTTLEIILNLIKENTGEQKVKKQARIDKKPKSLLFLLGAFFVVLFTPETLDLVLGPPPLRRRSLDLILSSISKQYAKTLFDFLKILKQRNKLLFKIKEGQAKVSQLDFWDQGFLQTSSFLRDQREKLLENLNNFLPFGLSLSYLPSPQGSLDQALKKQREKEVWVGFTLIGPQKDDFVFLWNKKLLSWFGSRGEIREGVIYFKLAEFEFIKQKIGSSPVLILDDVFSELDKKRREKLKKVASFGQTIFTTTSLSSLDSEIIKKAKVIELGG